MSDDLSIRFWGVRGSFPAPASNAATLASQRRLLDEFRVAAAENPALLEGDAARVWLDARPRSLGGAYGGNTSCAEVRFGSERLILDLGTGIREFGESAMRECVERSGLEGIVLVSHLHLDHVQGFPAWKQAYLSRDKFFTNRFRFFGGTTWSGSLEAQLHALMRPPTFPVDLREIRETGMQMSFDTLHEGKVVGITGGRVICRKLIHSLEESYGFRIERGTRTIAFATDHTAHIAPHRGLVELAAGADIFVTDCQLTLGEIDGSEGGVQKLGWGHTCPEYIAAVASAARPKRIVTTHHDPNASGERIEAIARRIEELCGIPTVPAYEGLVLSCGG